MQQCGCLNTVPLEQCEEPGSSDEEGLGNPALSGVHSDSMDDIIDLRKEVAGETQWETLEARHRERCHICNWEGYPETPQT